MPEPFESLRLPTVPVHPDPGFTRGLRARLERALALPRGVAMSHLDLDRDPPTTLTGVAPPGLVPYLIVDGARRAVAWYGDALGARQRGDPIVMDDGRIGHVALEVAGSVFYLADESPDVPVAAPRADDDATVSLVVLVPDVDDAVRRAAEMGARVERPPADYPYGRGAVIRDPFAHRWMLSSEPAEVTSVEPGSTLHLGQIAYASLWVPDVARASAFFGAVLGWTYGPGSGPQGRQVQGTTPRHGLWGGEDRSTLFCCYLVEDVDAASERVRAAGGTADEPTAEPYGRVASCVDDQGMRFAVFEPPSSEPGRAGDDDQGLSARDGDLAYVTLEVRDAAAARAFYGPVLGWRFSPGRVEDGWSVDDARIGLHGGHAEPTGVPLYRVDDIDDGVARVRASGGEATEPERQPYGMTTTCVDDQGTRFGLAEL
jgi:predicted enzyme related to lactoylglutathione lyase